MSDAQKDLLLSILAMDSYNRGYNAGIEEDDGTPGDGLGEVKNVSKVGTATISYTLADAGLTDEAINAGFYAIAYKIGDGETAETIISYRGTDDLAKWPWETDEPGSDAWNSYAQGLGFATTEQAGLAEARGQFAIAPEASIPENFDIIVIDQFCKDRICA